MMRYRKKPIVVEAFQLTDDPEMEAPAWFARRLSMSGSGFIEDYRTDISKYTAVPWTRRRAGGRHIWEITLSGA